jgi:hypothetical protein
VTGRLRFDMTPELQVIRRSLQIDEVGPQWRSMLPTT